MEPRDDRAYVLLSGGIDSATCLFIAAANHERVIAFSVDYGQRHKREIESARLLCLDRKIREKTEHRVFDISSVIPKTTLTDPNAPIPNVDYADISGVSPAYVPFRNGLLLSAAASRIAGEFPKIDEYAPHVDWSLYFGAHAEDAKNWAYADCTPEFLGAMANAIHVGTYHQLRLSTPLEWLTKPEIIRRGTELGVPYGVTWSCYRGGEMHCGVCPTCRARKTGFALARVEDPTRYAE